MVYKTSGGNLKFETCKICLMDDSASDWKATQFGCNYCQEYDQNFGNKFHLSHNMLSNNEIHEILQKFAQTIKSVKTESKYDCVVGLSGGLDSTYALHLAVNAGLRVLAVHMDNGWNSELAQHNIEGIIQKTGVDFETNVLDWDTYKKLQEAFFKADVVDIEMLYDHAAIATCFSLAKKHNVKTIIAGTNSATEGMRMPPTWSWINKYDEMNIRSIWANFGDGTSIDKFPFYSTFDHYHDLFFKKYNWSSIIDLLPYSKKEVEQLLFNDYGFQRYPYKHYESVFTRFYQGYILPTKFGVDKRKNHLSSLVLNGELSRGEALQALSHIPYPTVNELQHDKDYFLKKMGWRISELEEYLKRSPVSHWEFDTDEKFMRPFRKMDDILNKLINHANTWWNKRNLTPAGGIRVTECSSFGYPESNQVNTRWYITRIFLRSKQKIKYVSRKITVKFLRKIFLIARKIFYIVKICILYLVIRVYKHQLRNMIANN